MKKCNQATLTSILMAAAVTGLLTGCGSGSKTTANMTAETAAAAANMAYGEEAQMYQEFDMAPEAKPMDDADSGGLTSTNSVQPVSTSRKLIRNVNLSVETTSFDTLIAALTGSVTGFGGYVEQSDISGNSVSSSYNGSRYANLTVRVPSDKLDTFITQVEEQGNITNKSETTQDVTLQYSDIESRKKSLTIEQERIWALLEKADTLEAVIALEARLSEIRYQLESFESQLRTYDNQVDYSTIYISISEVNVFTPTVPDSVAARIQKGFSRNLDNVANGLVDFFVWLVSSLPVLVLLAVIIAIAFLIIRFVSRKRPPKEKHRKMRHEEISFWHRNLSSRKQEKPHTPAVPPAQPLPPLTTGQDEPQGLDQQNQQD